jgi:hypothetical protein
MASILSRRFRLPGLMRDLDNTPLGVQHPHDQVAVCPRAVDEAGHVAGGVRGTSEPVLWSYARSREFRIICVAF